MPPKGRGKASFPDTKTINSAAIISSQKIRDGKSQEGSQKKALLGPSSKEEGDVGMESQHDIVIKDVYSGPFHQTPGGRGYWGVLRAECEGRRGEGM